LHHLQTLAPATDAYSSIFYTITAIHGLHIVLGLGMLAYVLILPGGRPRSPYRHAVHNVGLYWHFVDAVWVIIVAVLYVLPHLAGEAP
jgi:heme/copper-type cytochrome/quinol oxidase subunit 3